MQEIREKKVAFSVKYQNNGKIVFKIRCCFLQCTFLNRLLNKQVTNQLGTFLLLKNEQFGDKNMRQFGTFDTNWYFRKTDH